MTIRAYSAFLEAQNDEGPGLAITRSGPFDYSVFVAAD
jgi:hypothetical protein